MPKTTKPRKVTPRATEAEAEQRTSEVYRLLVKGASRPDIIQFGSTKWGLVPRAIDNIIKAATQRLKVAATTIREAELGKALERREDLYRQALTTQQISVALQVDESRCKLLGLFAPQKLTVATEEENPYGKLTRDQARQALDILDALERGESPAHPVAPSKPAKRDRSKKPSR